ncbi:MAG: GTP 3',8-cyclase MoaA [Polaromonas sp.]|jgi:cyclic pyranopterin phosphate synthase
MIQKTINVKDLRQLSPGVLVPDLVIPAAGLLSDSLARPLRDLRISVTDRCNFRCSYCMPSEVFNKDYAFLPQSSLLSFEEIARLARIFVAHGVEKIRLTGGEPLLRKNLEVLIEMLASMTTVAGKPLDITLTTNASLLAKKAQSLKDAGLQRVTVSLDAMDDRIFRQMNDVDFPVADVLRGIEVANKVGLLPIKINMVVKRGTNDREIVPMASHFRHSGNVLRFIEYMDVGATNGWRMDEVLPSAQVIERINAKYPVTSIDANYLGETAERWRYADGAGEIGVISSVTQAFCSDCHRARLSTEGKLFLCLFASQGHDLRSLLRGDHSARFSDEQIASAIAHIWHKRDDRYSELRAALPADTQIGDGEKRVEMSYIGG